MIGELGRMSQCEKEQKLDMDKLEWLVPCRSDIQSLSLSILTLIERKKSFYETDDIGRQGVTYLIGVAFSLWRAVFLAHPPTTWSRNLNDAEEYLYRVVEDNIITYSDDKKRQEWVFGYYLNNANFRLKEIVVRNIIPGFEEKLRQENLIKYILEEHRPGSTPRDSWKSSFSALKIAKHCLAQYAGVAET